MGVTGTARQLAITCCCLHMHIHTLAMLSEVTWQGLPLHQLKADSTLLSWCSTALVCCVSRYTKQRAKPPRTPRSIHSGGHSQASPVASAKRVASYKPGLKTAAHLATQLSATSRRATPGRMPLPEVRFLSLFHTLDP